MRSSAIATVIYFLLTLVYKLFADSYNTAHTNIYWLYSSIVFMIILLDVRKNSLLKVYSRIFLSAAVYWGVMTVFHSICLFKIELYIHLNAANKFTVGAASIFLLLFYLTGSIFRHDRKTKG